MIIMVSFIITIASLITAVITIFALVFKIHNWYLKQEKQDAEIKAIKEEQRVMCKGVLACLDGLEQLGCNHRVPKAKEALENHINEVAHQ